MTTADRRTVYVSRTLPELRSRLRAERAFGRSIGFVPTMGALHAGHASLVQRAPAATDVAVASIFVNPLQFGPTEDLSRYPRTPEADLELLAAAGAKHLWMPEVATMYPPGSCTSVGMKGLIDVLCGRSRPTHFGGVLTVVLKLLLQVQPDIAFFGRKDYQQALVIRRMVRDLDVPTCIETCPIVRETDGLAMSSRNRYLTAEERAQAPALRAALLVAQSAFLAGERRPAALVREASDRLALAPLFRIDYLEIRDPETLELRDERARPGDLVAIAAHLGKARLTDNPLPAQD